MTLSAKDPAEIIRVTFDFTNVAAAIASATVTASLLSGTDDTNAAAIISGSAAVSGALVTQMIASGNPESSYALRCEADDADGERYVLVAELPVKTAKPA